MTNTTHIERADDVMRTDRIGSVEHFCGILKLFQHALRGVPDEHVPLFAPRFAREASRIFFAECRAGGVDPPAFFSPPGGPADIDPIEA